MKSYRYGLRKNDDISKTVEPKTIFYWPERTYFREIERFLTRQTAHLSSQSVLRFYEDEQNKQMNSEGPCLSNRGLLPGVIASFGLNWAAQKHARHDLCLSPQGNGDLPSWCGTAPIRLFSRFALNILALHSSLSNMLDLSRQIDQHCTVRSGKIWVAQRMVIVSSLISNTRIRRCFSRTASSALVTRRFYGN
jgi:hypothetical protein